MMDESQILLVNPCYNYPAIKKGSSFLYNKIWPPLSLANCAALLEKNGFNVGIIDANAEGLSPSKVAKKTGDSNKIFITSSSLDRWECPHLELAPFLECVKKIREGNPDSEIYVMGAHGTLRPKEILNLTKANALIRGEPELTVLEICKGNELSNINGLTYKKGKKIISNPDRAPLDLNSLPKPAFHLLPMKKYFYEVLGKSFALFEASRGCPFSCIFCSKAMYNNYRKKYAVKLIDEVRYAIENFNIKTAYFIDLEFTINKKLVEKLCDFLIKENYDFQWCCQTRVDSVDLPLLKKMKKAGCKLIHYGIETGSGRIMKLINKNITLEKIEESIKLTKKAGIETACFFLFGLPTETKEDMKKTINFAKKLDPTYASFYIAVPYPGTEFYNMVENELNGLFPLAYTGLYPLDILRKMKNKAFFQFYLRPTYIFSRISKGDFRSLFKQFKMFLRYVR